MGTSEIVGLVLVVAIVGICAIVAIVFGRKPRITVEPSKVALVTAEDSSDRE